MKKILALMICILSIALVGCKPVTTEESIYEPTSNHLDYISYYGYLNSENIFILMVREPILDTHYNTENGCYEYEIYGNELARVRLYENGVLEIIAIDGDRLVVKDYIMFAFDN
jgi:hypothetical protein